MTASPTQRKLRAGAQGIPPFAAILAAPLLAGGMLVGCCSATRMEDNGEPHSIPGTARSQLEEARRLLRLLGDEATELDVRRIFGSPGAIWGHGPGFHVFDYPDWGVQISLDNEGRVIEARAYTPRIVRGAEKRAAGCTQRECSGRGKKQ